MNQETIDVIREVRHLYKMQTAYLSRIPKDIIDFLYDNEYASYQEIKLGIFERALFGENLDMVAWFLYKFDPENPRRTRYIADSGVAHFFESEDAVLEYLAEHC